MTKAEKKEQSAEHRRQINSILTGIETRLSANVDKVSVAEFIRLSQYEREFDLSELPKEVKVTWVDKATRSETDV